MLLTSAVRNMQQFNAALPFIAVAMAMIGGAFWPIELVESKLMIALSHAMPIKYGMDMLHGAAVYGYPLDELFKPVSMLLLMGVLMMGIGIRLMEKRHVQ
ncbi:MAG TPA: ABC transporter permease [Cerasibacillus sp.]|uniref:ABC transporter permease n=1 Tax=Cerasibacillus sp. TaxID=2498711 RepID=UPI002F3F12D9